jgi:hypothetical protein
VQGSCTLGRRGGEPGSSAAPSTGDEPAREGDVARIGLDRFAASDGRAYLFDGDVPPEYSANGVNAEHDARRRHDVDAVPGHPPFAHARDGILCGRPGVPACANGDSRRTSSSIRSQRRHTTHHSSSNAGPARSSSVDSSLPSCDAPPDEPGPFRNGVVTNSGAKRVQRGEP